MNERDQRVLAPELSVSQWFNTNESLSLEKLRGRPVLIHAFQMLCPGCVAHAIPQAQKAQAIFAETDLQVMGLHTVFEHHDADRAQGVSPRIQDHLSCRCRHPFATGRDSHDDGGLRHAWNTDSYPGRPKRERRRQPVWASRRPRPGRNDPIYLERSPD
jgi:hypothetical protein